MNANKKPTERALPQNPEAESLVLGALVHFPDRLADVMEILKPADFYQDSHRTIYQGMCDYAREHDDRAPDLMTLMDLFSGDDLDLVLQVKILKDDMWSTDLMQDVRLILGASIQRQHYYASLEMAQIAMNEKDPDKAREKVERLLYELTMRNAPASDFDALSDVLDGNMADIEYAIAHRGLLQGVPTGYSDLDLMTNGLQKSDFIILGARPGVGKTSFAMNLAYYAARAGKTVAAFSLEMSKKQLGLRLLSLVSRKPSNMLRAGWVDKDDWQDVREARAHLAQLPIYIDDTSGAPVRSIRNKLRRLKAKTGKPIDLVVVDYVQLMEDNETDAAKRSNREQEISRISRGLKSIARDFDVPVLALAQLSRGVESRQSKVPQLSDLRESGSLEQDADIVMFLYREEMYNPTEDNKNMAELVIAKHRNGPLGEISLRFSPSLTRFYSIEYMPGGEDHASA